MGPYLVNLNADMPWHVPTGRACRGMGYCYKVSMLLGGDEDDGAVTALVYLHRCDG